MPIFQYRAKEADVNLVFSDQIDAASLTAAREKLEAEGLVVLSLELKTDDSSSSSASAAPSVSVSSRDADAISGYVVDLTKAGLPLADGLRALSEEVAGGVFPHRRLKRSLKQVAQQLDTGTPVVDVLKSIHSAPDLCAVVEAGLVNGRVADAVGEYTTHTEAVKNAGRHAALAAFYPIFVCACASALLLYLYLSVVPGFQKIFEDFGTELPMLTAAVLSTSSMLKNFFSEIFGELAPHWVVLVGFCVFVLFIGILFQSKAVRSLLSRIPIFGRIIRWGHIAKFSHLLAILIKQHQPVGQALRSCAVVTEDPKLKGACQDLAEQIDAGDKKPRLRMKVEGFPIGFLQLLASDNDPEKLAEAMHAVARMYESRVRVQAGLIGVFLKPIILIWGIAIPVGLTVIGLFLPLIKLLNSLASITFDGWPIPIASDTTALASAIVEVGRPLI